MKSNAPWSVKGIERDARETAKEAARREGMTVGEWLNQIIYAAGAPEGASGPIAGLKAADIVAAVEHLKKRIVAAESKSAAAVDDLARNLAGVVERLQRLERLRPTEGGASPDIEDRVARLEAKAFDRQRIDALKALEKAVAQAALQFDAAHKSSQARIEAAEKRLDDLARKMEAAGAGDAIGAIAPLKEALEGMSARIARAERIAAEAAQIKAEAAGATDSDFVERTGARLRALGDEIKRGGDQIRALEAAIKKMADEIDAAERRSAEGVHKVAESVEALQARLRRSEAAADAVAGAQARLDRLQAALDSLAARLDAAPAADPRPQEKAETNTPGVDIEAEIAEIDDAGQDHALFEDAAEPLHLAIEDEDEIGVAPEDDVDDDYRDSLADPSQDDDAFAFDLDDADDAENEQSVQDYAAALLSDAQDALNGPEAAPRDETDKPERALADEKDLDAAFKAFESEAGARGRLVANRETPPDGGDGRRSDVWTTEEDDAGDAAVAETAVLSLKTEARSEALRRLTPKQRAILAAKLRRRRLAQQGLSMVDADERTDAPATDAPVKNSAAFTDPEADGHERADENGEGVLARMSGAFGALKRQIVPGGRRQVAKERAARLAARPAGAPRAEAAFADDDDEFTPADDARRPADPDVSGTIRRFAAQIAARPLTMALGAAIVLAAAALFFLVKDSIFGEPVRAPQTEGPRAAAPDGEGETALAPAVDPRALYRESVALLKTARNEAQTREAMKGLEQAAALGHPPAQLQLGELYKLGQGAPQDLAAARTWYERAANGGNVLAMHRAGVMAARGQGGPADPEAAIGWFEKAASFGLVDSQYNLGALYHPGGNDSNAPYQDAAKAYFWYALAARNGDDQARRLAEGLAGGLPAEQRRALDQSVAAWTPQTPDPEANETAPAS